LNSGKIIKQKYDILSMAMTKTVKNEEATRVSQIPLADIEKAIDSDIRFLRSTVLQNQKNHEWLLKKLTTIRNNLAGTAPGSEEAALLYHSVLSGYADFYSAYLKNSEKLKNVETSAEKLASSKAKEVIIRYLGLANRAAQIMEENTIAFLKNPILENERQIETRDENIKAYLSNATKALMLLDWSQKYEDQARVALASPESKKVLADLIELVKLENTYKDKGAEKVAILADDLIGTYRKTENALRNLLSNYDPTNQFDAEGDLNENTQEMQALGRMMALSGKTGQMMIDRAYEVTWTEIIDKPETIKSEDEMGRVVLAALRHTQRIKDGYGKNFKVLETKTSADGKTLEPVYDKDGKQKMSSLFEEKTVKALEGDMAPVSGLIAEAHAARGKERLNLLRKAREINTEAEENFAEVYTKTMEDHQIDERYKTMAWHQKTLDWAGRYKQTLIDGTVMIGGAVAGGLVSVGTGGAALPLVITAAGAYWTGRGAEEIAYDYAQHGEFTFASVTGAAMMAPAFGGIAGKTLGKLLSTGKFARIGTAVKVGEVAVGLGSAGVLVVPGIYHIGETAFKGTKYGWTGADIRGVAEGSVLFALGLGGTTATSGFVKMIPKARAARAEFYDLARRGASAVANLTESIPKALETLRGPEIVTPTGLKVRQSEVGMLDLGAFVPKRFKPEKITGEYYEPSAKQWKDIQWLKDGTGGYLVEGRYESYRIDRQPKIERIEINGKMYSLVEKGIENRPPEGAKFVVRKGKKLVVEPEIIYGPVAAKPAEATTEAMVVRGVVQEKGPELKKQLTPAEFNDMISNAELSSSKKSILQNHFKEIPSQAALENALILMGDKNALRGSVYGDFESQLSNGMKDILNNAIHPDYSKVEHAKITGWVDASTGRLEVFGVIPPELKVKQYVPVTLWVDIYSGEITRVKGGGTPLAGLEGLQVGKKWRIDVEMPKTKETPAENKQSSVEEQNRIAWMEGFYGREKGKPELERVLDKYARNPERPVIDAEIRRVARTLDRYKDFAFLYKKQGTLEKIYSEYRDAYGKLAINDTPEIILEQAKLIVNKRRRLLERSEEKTE